MMRALLSDGRWHRARPGDARAAHDQADLAGNMPLHVEQRGDRFRVSDKAHCSLCAGARAEIGRLRARIAELEGGR